MNYYWFRILLRISLLRFAQFVLHGFIPSVIVLVLLFALVGCGTVEIRHEDGHKPKIHINTEYADDVKIRIRRKSIRVYIEWEI